jgi:GTP-binding protein
VGKSSLLNCLLQKNKVIVSNEPGTTRDITYAILEYKGQKIELADSAGIKRKVKLKGEIEKMTTKISLNLIKRCHVVLFVIDALEPLSRQDIKVADFAEKYRKSVIIVVNKWDQAQKRIEMNKYIEFLQDRFGFLYYSPVIFVSAKTGENVRKILDLIIDVAKEREKVISKEDLLVFLQDMLKKYPIKISIFDINQTGASPPQITILVGPKKSLPYPYLRLLEKQLRARFGFEGVPIKLVISNK